MGRSSTRMEVFFVAHTHNDAERKPLVIPASATAERMAQAAGNFLDTLPPALREQAALPFDGNERFRWHYIPIEMWERKGVSLQDLNEKQQEAAFALMASGLSVKGYEKARAIINLETTLGEIEKAAGEARLVRDPSFYFFTVFGDPNGNGAWGWRAEGHHVSLNFTVVNRELISPNPFFFGSNPAEVPQGEKKGLRVLSAEEDMARQLLTSLNAAQKRQTIINADAPSDIVTRDVPKVEFERVEGLAAESMETHQRELLMNLVCEYIDRLPEEIADIELRKLREGNVNAIHFAWAGGETPRTPHYYRLHGPFFFVEYDNTQNNANHIHSVRRHIADDFGVDLLRLHYHASDHQDHDHGHGH